MFDFFSNIKKEVSALHAKLDAILNHVKILKTADVKQEVQEGVAKAETEVDHNAVEQK